MRLLLDRSTLRRIALLWAVWSAAVLLLAGAAMSIPTTTSSPWTDVMKAPPLARWDAVWYRNVAVEGYRYDPSQKENNVGFYPLYPLLLRWISGLLGSNVLWTGIALSLVFLLAALILTADLFVQWAGDLSAALPGAATLLFFPTAFYFASVYTESLFLLATAAAIWGARRGLWTIAGIGGACACATRFNGFLVGLPMLWYAWSSVRRRESGLAGPAGALALTAAGALAFPAYLAARWGDPLLYVHSKTAGWGVGFTPPWRAFRAIALELKYHLEEPSRLDTLSFASQLASLVLFSVLSVALFRRGLPAEGLYCAATVLLLFSSGTVNGFDRYALALFPGFFVLSEYLRRHRVASLAGAFAGPALQASFLHRFVHWIMVS
jgi:hypothetical protein